MARKSTKATQFVPSAHGGDRAVKPKPAAKQLGVFEEVAEEKPLVRSQMMNADFTQWSAFAVQNKEPMPTKISAACQASPAYVHHTGAALVPKYTAQENGLCRKVAPPVNNPVRRVAPLQDIIPIFQQSSVVTDANALIHTLVASAITSAGYVGYVDASQAVQFADALYLDKAIVVGVSVGVGNRFVVYGVSEYACFTTHGGMPQNGKPVWLASSTDEVNAAGKLSATPCDVGFLVRVGTCIDNSAYTTQKKCKILVNPALPFIL